MSRVTQVSEAAVALAPPNDVRPFQAAIVAHDWPRLGALIYEADATDWDGWTLLGLAALLTLVALHDVAEEILPYGTTRVRNALVAAAYREGQP